MIENNQLGSWEAFLRDRDMLLKNYFNKFVAYTTAGRLKDFDDSYDALVVRLRNKYLGQNFFIEKVTEEAFKEPEVIDLPSIICTLEDKSTF